MKLSSFMIMIFLGFVISIPFYVYTSIAYMLLAKRTKTKKEWVAWVPFLRAYLISKIADMRWWPMFFFLPGVVTVISFLMEVRTGLLFIFFLLSTVSIFVFLIYWIIWHWKIFVKVGRPGWWSLAVALPYIGYFVYLVFLGIAAFGKPKKINNSFNLGLMSILLLIPFYPIILLVWTILSSVMTIILSLVGLGFDTSLLVPLISYSVFLLGSVLGYSAVRTADDRKLSKIGKVMGIIGLTMHIGMFLFQLFL